MKKIAKVMMELEEKLRAGLSNKGWSDEQINEIWELLLKQAEYSFNLGHATAYGLTSYQGAYLKTYYPKEFMTALLNSRKGDYAYLSKYINECKKLGITVLEPDINDSDKDFTLNKNNILFGLSNIKSIGNSSVKSIVNHRIYKSFDDFISRCPVDIKTVITLIKAGCFNKFNKNKALMLELYCQKTYTSAQYKDVTTLPTKKILYDLKLIQDEIDYKNKTLCLKRYNAYRMAQYLNAEKEKYDKFKAEYKEKYLTGDEADWQMESLSMYLTLNPYEGFLDILNPYEEFEENKENVLAGTIIDIKQRTDKRGGRYAYVDILNHEGKMVECVIWAYSYGICSEYIKKTNKIICKGKLKMGQFSIFEAKLLDIWLEKVKNTANN